MITGAHSVIYSTKAEEDRQFLRDVLKLPNVDVGGGWLIFGLPPAEVAVHPSKNNDVHEFYFMCDDIAAFIAEMQAQGVACAPVQSVGWGQLTKITLPGGGALGVYQPRHARPKAMMVRRVVAKKIVKKAAREVAKKKVRAKSRTSGRKGR